MLDGSAQAGTTAIIAERFGTRHNEIMPSFETTTYDRVLDYSTSRVFVLPLFFVFLQILCGFEHQLLAEGHRAELRGCQGVATENCGFLGRPGWFKGRQALVYLHAGGLSLPGRPDLSILPLGIIFPR